MWWRRQPRAQVHDPEGKEKAKRQYELAKALQVSARQLADEHRAIQQANHFGPTIQAALRERH